MESAGNPFPQSTVSNSSPHKLTSNFIFYPLAYLLFLFLLILCLDEDVTVELTEQENHPSGTLISREGEYSDCMYIIVKGTVAISTGDTVLTQLGPKDFFGEVAVFEGARRTADVVAEDQEVELLRIGRDDLLRVMEELPAIAICICQTLSRRVRALTERVNP